MLIVNNYCTYVLVPLFSVENFSRMQQLTIFFNVLEKSALNSALFKTRIVFLKNINNEPVESLFAITNGCSLKLMMTLISLCTVHCTVQDTDDPLYQLWRKRKSVRNAFQYRIYR